jgi:hypothetical protein
MYLGDFNGNVYKFSIPSEQQLLTVFLLLIYFKSTVKKKPIKIYYSAANIQLNGWYI